MKISKAIMIIATIAFSMSMLLASANAQVVTDSTAATTLIGTVVDATTDEGIAGAEVTIEDTDQSVTTDEYGTFTIENLEEGTYTVKVNAEGYITAEKEVEITEEGASVEFVLETEEK